ncbi:MAG: sensor histidine kinase, partial [Ardenticatenaceae bacterium]
MTPFPTLVQFAELVATGEDNVWSQQFVDVVRHHLPDTEAAVLWARSGQPESRGFVPLASTGDPSSPSPDSLERLPSRGEGELVLSLPGVSENDSALWLATTLALEEAQRPLAGWLAVAGMGIARRQQALEMERQRKARDHFFSMVNHDLKGPLASIKAMTDLIMRKVERGTLDPASEEGRADLLERLTFLSRRAKDMARLIDQIGDVTTIERGRLLLNRRWADLRSILRTSVERIELETGRTIDIEANGEPLLGEVDEYRLMQVLHILLKNALDYSEPETPVTARMAAGDRHLQLEITDQGRGISAQQKALLFQEYGRAVQNMSCGLGVG